MSYFAGNEFDILSGSVVANPITYRLVPSPSRYEIWQLNTFSRSCAMAGGRLGDGDDVFQDFPRFWRKILMQMDN